MTGTSSTDPSGCRIFIRRPIAVVPISSPRCEIGDRAAISISHTRVTVTTPTRARCGRHGPRRPRSASATSERSSDRASPAAPVAPHS